MINRIVLLWQLLVIAAIMLILGLLLVGKGIMNLSVANVIVMVNSAFVIAFISGLIFLSGQNKDEKTRAFYTLVSLGTKFLLYLLFILVWWALSKNISKTFIIAFFVLYLVFTIFLTSVYIKALKIK